ncbi:hypothetical protein ACFQGT_19825 [Natrialbaceae archaeon GCM10025810]|uniref:hypothetical protein n=1 Tax=Halovalidus salilacus TaxID=3075124 RepID=UPI00361757BA
MNLNRRTLVAAVGGAASSALLAGCGEAGPGTSQGDGESADDDEDEDDCETETETETALRVENERDLGGGLEWTHGYEVEDGETLHFDVTASDGQDVHVEIESPGGDVVFEDEGASVSATEGFDQGGTGRIRIANYGDRTEEETEELWDDEADVSAGDEVELEADLVEGERVEYRVERVDGARPQLRIEDPDGEDAREHDVSSMIDDEFVASADGEYRFVVENTALLRSGEWEYALEAVEEVPVETTVDLRIEYEYEEPVEICA